MNTDAAHILGNVASASAALLAKFTSTAKPSRPSLFATA
jgi:hypothetical protein